MKKTLCILLACAMLLSLLAGCGNTDKSQGTQDPQDAQPGSSETADSSAPAEKDPIVISMCGAITGDYSEYGLGYQAATKVQVDK